MTATSNPHSLTSQADWQNRNVWVTHRFRLCLDHGLIDRTSNRQSIIPERQTKRFVLQLRTAKLQINMLSPPDLHVKRAPTSWQRKNRVHYVTRIPSPSPITALPNPVFNVQLPLLCVFPWKVHSALVFALLTTK